ncbi:Uma2 family endonuclease [Tautonia rosea]|uniref:Uma2 family endonuclease n=1 Tax=Tautonia rosea TaxID=2728037 RepID=UPI001473EDA8|nr:Uma2 family endonuclease [Tautonia rosea]
MSTRTRPMTSDELLRFDDPSVRVELDRGKLITMPLPGGEHGMIASEILVLLAVHVKANRLGRVFAAETGFLLHRNPDTVRGADVAFVAHDRLAQVADRKKHLPLASDLLIEIVSPTDRPGRIASKLTEWLDGGARLVWWVYSDRREVEEHRPGRDPRTIPAAEHLDGGDVLPGFRVRVSDLFDGGG